MDVYLLNGALNKIHIIDGYTSLIWADRYNDLGDCELVIPATVENVLKVQQSIYISREDSDLVCRIEKIELTTDIENGDYIIITGVDIKKILQQRIIWTQTNFNGLVEDYIRKLINDNAINPTIANRKISKLILDTKANFPDTINEQVTFNNLGEKIQELCKTYNWGYKVYINENKKFVFKLYNGTDRSGFVIFSDDYENLSSTDYINDTSNISTIALVAGEGEGTARITQTSGSNTSDLDRYELYVDARDLSKTIAYDELLIAYPGGTEVTIGNVIYYQVDGINIAILTKNEDLEVTDVQLTDNIYNNTLESRGQEKLAEHKALVAFEGSIQPTQSFTYKEDYFLGDIVSIENHYGISVEARIVEIIEVDNENGYSIEPKFEYLSDIKDEIYLLSELGEVIETENNEKIIIDRE